MYSQILRIEKCENQIIFGTNLGYGFLDFTNFAKI
jgi:hypothetical protein